MPTLVVSALSTFDNKGLKKGKKEVSAFEKQVKSFGKVFAGVFSATALLNYSKNAVKAFMADEKAAKSLEQQLKNTGYAFAAPSVEYYISNLQKVSGVLDDELRPAFQQLLTASGSITKSQEALNTALDISAATGKSLTEVSAALSRGFAGNTTGLSRLGAGLSKAILKTGNMDKILGELNQKFSGQASARLETYAGKMDLLKVSAANASEIIGKGLLDSLQVLSKDDSIENAGQAMEDFATDIANATYGMALLIAKTKEFLNLPGTNKNLGGPLSFIPIVGPLLETVAKYGGTEMAKPKSNFTYELGASATKDIERAKEILRLKSANKLRTEENAKIKAKNDLERLKDKYDLERIGLIAALNAATDEETRTRIAEKLAILDGNAARADEYLAMYTVENAALEAAKALIQAGNSALYFKDWADYRSGERGDSTSMSNVPSSGGGGITMPSAVLNTQNSDWLAYRAGERGDVNINVAGSLLTDQDLTDTIQRTILQINKQGRGTTPAGGLSGGT